jgi:ABC-2 type transport system ATP-binding protein
MKNSHSYGDLAIEAHQLVKSYGDKRAIDGVDLNVRKGSIYGVLGPNGAGKTTTVRVLATLLHPEGGNAKVLGYDVAKQAHEVRKRICLTGQFASVDEDLTGRENLVLLSRLLGIPRSEAIARSEELLKTFDLFDAKDKQVKNFSGGMRRRLDIAASIIRVPELLFLDEPTTGLDPRSRNQVWEIIRGLASDGTTILLTTQYLEEADQLAERIAVIDHGRVIAEGTPAELKRSVGTGMLHVRLIDPSQRELAQQLLSDGLQEEVQLDAESRALTAKLTDTSRAATALATLATNGIAVSDFSVGQPSLDEVFFALTGVREEDCTEEQTPQLTK